MHFTVITLFPDFFVSPLGETMLKRAVAAGLLEVATLDLRKHGVGRHRLTDDTPYGGGAGMVMKPEPVVAAIREARTARPRTKVVLLTPQGARFDQAAAHDLAAAGDVTLVCGRYEGFDERVRDFVDAELSVGDFVLSGGEPAAVCVIDAVARLVPGVLGNAQSAVSESFAAGGLEYPQYTRPPEFEGRGVPDVLLSGDHGRIEKWRKEQALRRTKERRPDLEPPGGSDDKE